MYICIAYVLYYTILPFNSSIHNIDQPKCGAKV